MVIQHYGVSWATRSCAFTVRGLTATAFVEIAAFQPSLGLLYLAQTQTRRLTQQLDTDTTGPPLIVDYEQSTVDLLWS